MRLVIFSCALIMAACAGQPTTPTAPGTAPPTTVVAKASQKPPAGLVGADGKINAEALANARKMGFTPVSENGQVLYCRTDLKTGSHLARETICMTLDEFEKLREQTNQTMGDIVHRPAPPSGH